MQVSTCFVFVFLLLIHQQRDTNSFCFNSLPFVYSFDQDCPDDEVATAGVCDKGSRGGLSCEFDSECPQGKGFATCGSSTTTTPGVCTEVIIPDDDCCNTWCRQTEVYGDYMTRAGPGDWYEPPYPTDGSGNFNTNFCACGGTYKATCAINAWDIQKNK